MATLRYYIDRNYDIMAYCDIDLTCTHYGALNLEALAARFGDDFNVVERRQDMLDGLICSKCRRKGITIRIMPPNGFGSPRR